MKLEHVLYVQFFQRPTPFTFCTRLSQASTTVLSFSLSLSTSDHFFISGKHWYVKEKCKGMKVGILNGIFFLPLYFAEVIKTNKLLCEALHKSIKTKLKNLILPDVDLANLRVNLLKKMLK